MTVNKLIYIQEVIIMLEAKAMEITNQMENIMKGYTEMLGGMDVIKEMDIKTFELMQNSFKLMDMMNEYQIAQAKQLDDINFKLDKLLSK